MTMILRIGRYVLIDVLRNRWILAYLGFFLLATDLLLRLAGSGPRALVSLLNLVLLLVPLVTIVFGTIYWHGAREFNTLLLTQPVDRGRLFHGLFAGLVLPLSMAFVGGVTVPLLLHRAIGPEAVPLLVLMLVAGVALTAVFAAIAVLIGGLVEDRLRGLAAALGVWILLTVAYDAVVLWIAVAWRDAALEGPLLALTFLNPVDLARVLLVSRLDVAALLGYTGAVFTRAFGGATGVTLAVAGLAMWALVPGLLALRAFRRRDF
ncbi:MAG: ABC transporter permease subunit [Gemmatimonadaceae bacterium]|nr:ABC transporter permease subunit [Gemmatimonadaceae bacterium]